MQFGGRVKPGGEGGALSCKIVTKMQGYTVVKSNQRAYNLRLRRTMYTTESNSGTSESQPPSTDGVYVLQKP